MNNVPTRTLLSAAIIASLTGCLSETTTNNDNVQYTPDSHPLSVVAGQDAEFAPGSDIVLKSRLVGTVAGQTMMWEQTAGPDVTIVDPTQSQISFVAPDVVGSQLLTFVVHALNADGTAAMDSNNAPIVDEINVKVFDPDSIETYEVETDADVVSTLEIITEGHEKYIAGASGKYHTADIEGEKSVIYTINKTSENAGFYSLFVRYAIPADYGGKEAKVVVNGVPTILQFEATGSWNDIKVATVELKAGDNIIEIGGAWNYYRIDNIYTIPDVKPPVPSPVPTQLTNDNATTATKKVFELLASYYGNSTLSGQTEFPTNDGSTNDLVEFNKVTSATGDDAPAIVAFDLMEYSATRVENGANPGTLTEDMIKHHNEKNVMLSALWHWNAPAQLKNGTGEEAWYKGFYTGATDFDLAAVLADTNSAEYAALIADIDIAAAELQKLEDADIPVLWRPLHEAQGKWFWWGAAGSQALKDLWVLMYDRMTQHHGLDNLIWVYTYAGDLDASWYPGDDYVDIVGYDGYDGTNDKNAFSGQFSTLRDRHNGQKMVALTETGSIPDVEAMHAANAWWAFYITWNTSDSYGPGSMDAATIDANYAFDSVINLSDLPGAPNAAQGPGVYENFDHAASYVAQINWGNQALTSLNASTDWAGSGSQSLRSTMDLAAITDWPEFPSTVIQSYPANGIDVKDATLFSLKAHSLNAGDNITGKLWIKHGEAQTWADAGAIALTDGGTMLSIDVSDYDLIAGFGVQFEGFEQTSAAAKFYIDSVMVDDTVFADFDETPSNFIGQLNWANTSGLGITDSWMAQGAKSLALTKDLSAKNDWGDTPSTVIQNYPENGIDISSVSSLKLNVNSMDAGAAVTGKLWIKHSAEQTWVDAGAVALTDGGTELELDVSGYDLLAGFGVQYEGFDTTSSNAKFYMDNVRLDDKVTYGFEQTGAWEGQLNWAPTTGLTTTQAWGSNNTNSLVLTKDLSVETLGETPSTTIQTYPNLSIAGVSQLNLTVNTTGAGDGVTAKLFIKHGESQTWVDAGAQAITADGIQLSIDVSEYSLLAGWGVQFEGFDTSSTDAKFYIDSVTFTE
ncbi:glycosyl hydrolase [Algibacillus agarilyticus]|uniref:glycosyl hydrolase n=1 Tax=Algibacillus agarilyticus TaxID=2234133 RepID=UPI0018E5A445|nr:glycosyl hydrolase [Algibacillus agarilyticus]